jgi:hypothetical protein
MRTSNRESIHHGRHPKTIIKGVLTMKRIKTKIGIVAVVFTVGIAAVALAHGWNGAGYGGYTMGPGMMGYGPGYGGHMMGYGRGGYCW